MKFALITADPSHKISFRMRPETDDVTSFMQWVSIFNGVHLSYNALRNEDNSYLKKFDVVMMSGHPSHISDIIRIGRYLKDSDSVTMFYPEGSTQLYDNSINGFHPEYYEAWRACDIVSMAEEDKQSYYEAFVGSETIVKFIHVPATNEMVDGGFFSPREDKRDEIIVYGDNNPNHPLIAMAAINGLCERMNKNFMAIGIETRDAEIKRVFPKLHIIQTSKQGQYPFLRMLRRGLLNFYPTEWIGTARHQVSCAVAGTPCIGNKDSHTQRRLFPSLGVNIYDVKSMVDLAEELLNNNSLHKQVCDFAFNEASFYNRDNTVLRFKSAVEEATKKFKKASVPT